MENNENRQEARYKEIGRIIAPEICSLTGILDDISSTGCKVHYPFPVVVELENEYEIKIAPTRTHDETPLKLICVPQWVNEKDGNTHIGFKILYSPDAARLAEFISYLEHLNDDQEEEIL